MSNKKGGSPQWMATFADLMSLLMALFVLLFAMSSVDISKYEAIVKSFNETLGQGSELTPEQETFFQSVQKEIEADPLVIEELKHKLALNEMVNREMMQLYKELSNRFAGSGEGAISVEYDEVSKEVKLVFPEQIAFDPGKAELKPRFMVLLRKLQSLHKSDLIVKVVGHTDSRPVVGGRFCSNWELSSARASSVITQLIRDGSIEPSQGMAVGVADTQPIDVRNTEEAFAKNRRVEVLVAKRNRPTLPVLGEDR
ncbi:flagellar motor protein MotB [Thiomicrorhabdus sp. 6S3-12]|uniref:flagellar motor protein MotB n=1 Tax=Thiomicrorhabdus sp. 6S3-12 TaxID=2819681 RepID=UPI001AAD2BBB|nr:flagellar motor protein MotB [Thiomicrorhabdus sp. 6S3-12]